MDCIVHFLPPANKEEGKKWFKESLLKDGARENGGRTLTMEKHGVKVEIDIDKEEVLIKSEKGEEFNIQNDHEKRISNVADNKWAFQKTAQEQINKNVTHEIKKHRDRIRRYTIKAFNDMEQFIKKIDDPHLMQQMWKHGFSVCPYSQLYLATGSYDNTSNSISSTATNLPVTRSGDKKLKICTDGIIKTFEKEKIKKSSTKGCNKRY